MREQPAFSPKIGHDPNGTDLREFAGKLTSGGAGERFVAIRSQSSAVRYRIARILRASCSRQDGGGTIRIAGRWPALRKAIRTEESAIQNMNLFSGQRRGACKKTSIELRPV